MKTNDVLDWKTAFNNCPDTFWNNLSNINLNGNTGDNIMHPEIFEMVEWLSSNSNAKIMIHTNGSIRKPEWWSKFGDLLKNKNHSIVFGIDGLANTHEIHRIGTNWQRIIDNATAFIDAGGIAEWQFILFAHNSNEIEECRNISKQLGFSRFFVLHQDRFPGDDKMVTKDFVIEKFKGDLSIVDVNHEGSKDWSKTDFKNSCVSCKSQRKGWLAIYADATVWPCCYLMGWHKAKHMGLHYQLVNKHLKNHLKFDSNTINLYSNNLESIISSELWQVTYPSSFTDNPNPICRQQCSV
jgi:hypothetical protein